MVLPDTEAKEWGRGAGEGEKLRRLRWLSPSLPARERGKVADYLKVLRVSDNSS